MTFTYYYYLFIIFISILISNVALASPNLTPESDGLKNVKITLLDDVSAAVEWTTKTSRTCIVTCKQRTGNAIPIVQTVNTKPAYIDGLIADTNYILTVATADGKTQCKHEIPFQTLTQKAARPSHIKFKNLDEYSVEIKWKMHVRGIVKHIINYSPTDNLKAEISISVQDRKISKVTEESKSVILTKLIPDTKYRVTITSVSSRKKKYVSKSAVFRTEKSSRPTNLDAKRSDSDPHSVIITWKSPSGNVRGYEILYKSVHDKSVRAVKCKSTIVNLTNLEIDTQYTYSVVAIKSEKRFTSLESSFRTFNLKELFLTHRFEELKLYSPTETVKLFQYRPKNHSFDFYRRMRIIIDEIHYKAGPAIYRIKINISRMKIVEDTFALLNMHKDRPQSLQHKLKVRFIGEQGVDDGGLITEWMNLFSTKVFHPELKFFKYADENSTNVEINPESGKSFQDLIQFQLIGLFTAMALLHERHLNVYFSLPFLKTILLRPISLDDVKGADPDLYPGLLWMMNNDPKEQKLKLKFTAPESEKIKLIDNGDKILVTKKNTDKYIRLLINWRFIGRVELQTAAFLKGFYSLLPLRYIHCFTEDELQTLIGGTSKIDLDFWKNCTTYFRCSPDDEIVKWFWKAVGDFSKEMKAKLLEFVTGTSRFAIDGTRKFKFVIGFDKSAKVNGWPKVAICWNAIMFPKYESYENLCDKLIRAIQYGLEFGDE